jgi:hypothetical protein
MDMEILRRKDVYNHEANERLTVALATRDLPRWYGRGCVKAGFAPGSVAYPYYLVPLAGHYGCQDVTVTGAPGSPRRSPASSKLLVCHRRRTWTMTG